MIDLFGSRRLTGHYDGAIMLTASHMPFNSNGLKFFTADGGLEKNDISEILQLATQVWKVHLIPFLSKAHRSLLSSGPLL